MDSIDLKEWLLYHKDAVGYAATFLCAVANVPQIVRIYRNKSAKDVSFPMFALWITGSCIWLTYGIMERLKPIILTNLLNLTVRFWVLATKVFMDHKNGDVRLDFLNRFIRPKHDHGRQ